MAEGNKADGEGLDATVPFERASPHTAPLPVGACFAGRYRIEELLGSGGMGAVYRVHDESLDEDVALKVMTFADGDAARRFIDEVRLARRVTHQNVARTHDIGEHDGRPYLTMEYVKGDTLDSLIQGHRGVLPRLAASIGAQIAAGLEAAHASQVIHLDLKPGNVLLRADGRVVITDFGIARARGEGVRQTNVVGTPAYMSPEQACGELVDARSDLYALGTMLYELLAGELPFDETEPMAMAIARLLRPPAALRTHVEVPPALEALVMALLARDPEGRPGSAAEVRAALEAIAAGDAPTPSLRPSLRPRLVAGEHALAILPFRYRGPVEHDYFAQGLAEGLIDSLSRTRGLKVLALGAVARFAGNPDPLQVGSELGVDSLVEGQVRLVGVRLRLVVRLHDAKLGLQLWSDSIDVAVGDLFAMEESLARRIAEALRLELGARPVDRHMPGEAIELYIRARRLIRSGVVSDAHEAIAGLDRVIELAPGFGPALAAHAMASVRIRWADNIHHGGDSARTLESVDRAEQHAAGVAETHLASGMLAMQRGAFGDVAVAFRRALEIAPTMAEAHQHLGMLEVEADRLDAGLARLRHALDLDPTLNVARLALARVLGWLGSDEECNRHLADAVLQIGESHLGVMVCRLRLAMQRNDREDLARLVRSSAGTGLIAVQKLAAAALGELPIADAEAHYQRLASSVQNRRFVAGMSQIRAEIYAFLGHEDISLGALEELGRGVLVDVTWLEHAGVLASLRGHPRFRGVEDVVKARAAATWVPEAPRQ